MPQPVPRRTPFAPASLIRGAALAGLALSSACGRGHHVVPGGGNGYAVSDALAVGNGALVSGNAATAYYPPQPAGSPAPAATLGGSGQIAYGPDGSLYRYNNGTSGCTISKYSFGATGAPQPVATATGDPQLSGTTGVHGCFASATDVAGNVYVLVASGPYLGVDIFDAQLVYQKQIGNGPNSGIVANGRIPALPIAVDSTGLLYVGENNAVVTFDATNGSGDALPVGTLPVSSLSLAIDQSSNNLYVGSATAVNVFQPSAAIPIATLNLPVNTTGPSSQIGTTNALAIDSQTDLYVLTSTPGGTQTQVYFFTANFTPSAPPAATLSVAAGAASISVAP